MKVGLFYGSTTGNTKRVAEMIRTALGKTVTVFKDIRDTTPEEFTSCDKLILGISTWEEGALQEHWKVFFPALDRMDLHGKTVALFGLGDQAGYSGRFQDAMGTLYHKVCERGATVVGAWPRSGYRAATSTAFVGEHFVGLALDEDTEKHLTSERVRRWVELIRPFLA
jgi:flavodoxin long chain